MNRKVGPIFGILVILTMWGCRAPTTDLGSSDFHSTYNVQKTAPEDIAREDTIVFVRPNEFSVNGTTSLRDYIEVTHESVRTNNAGLLEVMIGLRNIGGTRWYDGQSQNFVLSVKTVFYDQAFNTSDQSVPPIYETNWESIRMIRGSTTQYKSVCPLRSGTHYQIIISELLR